MIPAILFWSVAAFIALVTPIVAYVAGRRREREDASRRPQFDPWED